LEEEGRRLKSLLVQAHRAVALHEAGSLQQRDSSAMRTNLRAANRSGDSRYEEGSLKLESLSVSAGDAAAAAASAKVRLPRRTRASVRQAEEEECLARRRTRSSSVAPV
jgi:hypothetical protein